MRKYVYWFAVFCFTSLSSFVCINPKAINIRLCPIAMQYCKIDIKDSTLIYQKGNIKFSILANLQASSEIKDSTYLGIKLLLKGDDVKSKIITDSILGKVSSTFYYAHEMKFLAPKQRVDSFATEIKPFNIEVFYGDEVPYAYYNFDTLKITIPLKNKQLNPIVLYFKIPTFP